MSGWHARNYLFFKDQQSFYAFGSRKKSSILDSVDFLSNVYRYAKDYSFSSRGKSTVRYGAGTVPLSTVLVAKRRSKSYESIRLLKVLNRVASPDT